MIRKIFTLLLAMAALGISSSQGAEKNVGNLYFHNNYDNVTTKVLLYHRQSPDRVWKDLDWRFPAKRRSNLTIDGTRIKVRGDWWIRLEFSDGGRTRKFKLTEVGSHQADGKWHVFASNVDKGRPPKVRLPISASRGAARWTIDSRGVVTSHIKYTVGSGSGSKRYATGLIVEFADGSVYAATATKTVGKPAFGSVSGTATNQNHRALPVRKLNEIRRVYVRYSVGSSGPSTIKEWVDWVVDTLNDGEQVYKELKDNELIQDAVKIYAGT